MNIDEIALQLTLCALEKGFITMDKEQPVFKVEEKKISAKNKAEIIASFYNTIKSQIKDTNK